MRATPIVNRTPTGTIIPTVLEFSAGTKMKSTSIRIIGAIASFRFLDTKTTAREYNAEARP